MATCYFINDNEYIHYYVREVNDKFFLGLEEFDFDIRGYEIRKLSRIKKVVMRDDKTNEINEKMGLTRILEHPYIDLSTWQTILNNEVFHNELIEIECYNNGTSYFGKILKVFKNKILFQDFDADGIWQEPIIIKFKDIDAVIWDSWYLNGWKFYFEKESY